MNNSIKFKEIPSASSYCIISPEVTCLRSVSEFHYGRAIFKPFHKIKPYILKNVNL